MLHFHITPFISNVEQFLRKLHFIESDLTKNCPYMHLYLRGLEYGGSAFVVK